MVKNLLIDLDGTLLGSHAYRLRTLFIFHFVKELRTKGLSLTQALTVLRDLDRVAHASAGQATNHQRAIDYLQAHWKNLPRSETEFPEMLHRIFSRLRPCFYPLPGATEFIDAKKGRFNLVLATNPAWPLEVVQLRLRWAGFHGNEFSYISHNENMRSLKPRESYYRELLTAIHAAPETCLMIGDSERKDGPARRLGIHTYILPKTDRRTMWAVASRQLEEIFHV